MTRKLWSLTIVVAAFGGCASPDAVHQDVRQPVVYGDDDRHEYFEATPAHQAVADSTVAFLNSDMLTPSGPGWDVVSRAYSLGEAYELCPDERFAAQPSPAWCSGFLIAEDLVATAGHCLEETPCSGLRMVFDFHLSAAADVNEVLPGGAVFSCAEVVEVRNDDSYDYAVVRLDRPAAGRTPLERSSMTPSSGDEIAVVGYPSGIPVKVTTGPVTGVSDPWMFGAVDTFGGNSGSVVLGPDGGVAGILTAGEEDYVLDEAAGCYRVNVCAPDGCDGSAEVMMLSSVVAGFFGAEPGAWEDCDDGVDNDEDGLVDCDDPSCELSPSCGCSDDLLEPNDAPGNATAVGVVTDGATISFEETVVTAASPDFFSLTVPPGCTVDIGATFAHDDGDLDLRLLDADGAVEMVSETEEDEEALSWTNTTGQPAPLFVEAFLYAGLCNSYTLTLQGSCSPSGDDDDDDDDDDDATGDDDDATGDDDDATGDDDDATGDDDDDASPEPQEVCDDGQDNDSDGALDCDDYDCAADPVCSGAGCACNASVGRGPGAPQGLLLGLLALAVGIRRVRRD